MAGIGSYGSTYAPFTPSNILLDVNDPIIWDWMDACSQFTQRYMKMATLIATVAADGTQTFDYGALRCDMFPPILKVYPYGTAQTAFVDGFDLYARSVHNWRFQEIGLGTAKLVNNCPASKTFLMIAYL